MKTKRIKTLHEVRKVCLVDHAFNFTNSKQRSCKGKKIYMLENKYGADSSCGHEEFPRCQGKREAVLAFLRWTIASNFRFSRRHPAAAKWSVCTNRAKSFGWVSRGSILSSEI